MSDPFTTPPPLALHDDLEDLFEAAPCGYLLLSPSGRVTRVNATFARWVGLPAKELINRPFRQFLTVPGRILYETNFAPLLRIQGGFEEVALDVLTPAGEKIPMLVNASERRTDANAVTAIRVVLVRARDRRGYERELHAREQRAIHRLTNEEETARLREQFIAVLGHDLRNPLASIAGVARLLRREVQSEKALKLLQLMEASVDRMAGLIDDVMDFARGRLGQGITVDRSPMAVRPILQQVVGELEVGHPGRTIFFEFDGGDICDIGGVRLAQMVSNLLANALAHGDAKSPVYLLAHTTEDELRIEVTNKGNPIPPAIMDSLFQPFFRGEVRASKQGLGLGLYIASEIARSHEGSLSATSTIDETRFSFVMPRRRAAVGR